MADNELSQKSIEVHINVDLQITVREGETPSEAIERIDRILSENDCYASEKYESRVYIDGEPVKDDEP